MPPSGHRRSDARVRTHTQTDKPEITAPAAPSTGWAKVKMIQEVCCKYMKQIRVQKLQACKMSIKTGQRPTELSDGSVGGGSAAGGGVSDVEKTKNKRVRRIVVHVLRPPRHAAVWFTSGTAGYRNSHGLQGHQSTCRSEHITPAVCQLSERNQSFLLVNHR